jgi:hypothetical protein
MLIVLLFFKKLNLAEAVGAVDGAHPVCAFSGRARAPAPHALPQGLSKYVTIKGLLSIGLY